MISNVSLNTASIESINGQYSGLINYAWTISPKANIDTDEEDPPKPVSGIWKPIIIAPGSSPPKYCEPLTFSKTDKSQSFTPCNCSTTNFSDQLEGFYDRVETSTVNCTYCSTSQNSVTWYLYTDQGDASPALQSSNCCEGICDTRLNKDDYLPKIPMLNQSMLSGFVDFKYMNEFPGCNNPGLGAERYLKFDRTSVSGEGLILSNCDMYIDWKIKECISEVPYDLLTSQHSSKYVHEKTYRRALNTSKTAGNFICLQNIGITDIPDTGVFTAPYGFNKGTYNNIFWGGEKIGSYWKWNYLSGVLQWRRYFEGSYENFVSPGEFFYATLDGPEPYIAPSEEELSERRIEQCPSGLKIVDSNGDVSHIIESGTKFCYISENIYPLFKTIFDRVINVVTGENIVETAIDIAGTLATGPQYDNITVDLLANTLYAYNRNEFFQFSGMNEDMNSGMHYGSAFDFSYFKNTKQLIKNLRHKYGQYIWIPPRTTATIELENTSNGFLELDYDLVADKNQIKHSTNNSASEPSYTSPLQSKCFAYSFDIKIGNNTVLYCDPFNNASRSIRTCAIETGLNPDQTEYKRPKFSISDSAVLNSISFDGGRRLTRATTGKFYDKYPRIVLDESNILDYCDECDPNSSYYVANKANNLCSKDSFCDHTLADYFRGNRVGKSISDNSLVLKRNYYAQALNPRIDAISIHPNYGSAVESKMFGLDKAKTFFRIDNDNKGATRAGNIKIRFTTYDVGIKIYDLKYQPLQSENSNMNAKRFPVDYDNLCKCEPIIPQYAEYNYISGTNAPFTLGPSAGYTPNVSVKNYSPNLRRFGSYSQEYLNTNFPGQNLTGFPILDLSTRIDVEYPLGRSSRSKSVNLPNYHTTKWQFNTTANTISVSETSDLYGNSYKYNSETDDADLMNTNWKRFNTRIELDDYGKSIYNAQSTSINPGLLNVTLVNPFLETLTESKAILHPPTVTGANHFFSNTWGLFGPRGDEMSSVTLSFKESRSKELLYFSARNMQGSNLELTPVKFEIDKNIAENNQNDSQINKSGLIPYDNLNVASNTLCFKGFFNNNIIRSLNNIYNANPNKKPKIIINIGNNFYQYVDYDVKAFQYTIPSQNKQFTGPPLLYEYIYDVQNSKKLPYMAPIHKKYQPYLRARYNSITPEFRNVNKQNKIFDILVKNNEIDAGSTIILPGIRHYFSVPANNSIYDSSQISFSNIGQLSDNIVSSLKYGEIVRFSNDKLFMYIGGIYNPEEKLKASNYLSLDNIQIADRLLSPFCNLSLDLSNVSNNILANSVRYPSDHFIKLYRINGSQYTRKVLKKSILIKYYLPNKRETRQKDNNFRLFTRLDLAGSINPNFKHFVDTINSQQNLSFAFYDDAYFSENNDKSLLIPNLMYGDLTAYDGNIINQPIYIGNIDFDILPVPKSAYENAFYKLILSDFEDTIDFTFYNSQFTELSSITGISKIQYNITQKYALDQLNLHENYYVDSAKNYQNYYPVLDVNIFGTGTQVLSKNPYIEYYVKSNRLWSNNTDPANGHCYLLNLNTDATLINIGSSNDDEIFGMNMWSTKTPFALKKINKVNNYTSSDTVQQLASSKQFNDLYNTSLPGLTIQRRDYPFIIYDMYSIPENCNGDLNDKDCDANRVGSIDLKTELAFLSGSSMGGTSVSTLEGQPIKIGISYDDGIGMNFTSSNLYTTIKRGVDSQSFDLCSSPGSQFLPQLIYDQKQDSAYWNSIVDTDYNETSLVSKTDIYANEILFRVLYGQNDSYNSERLFFEEEAITYEKIIDELYQIEAKDLYKDIPYNYDRTADMRNFYMDHTINIHGTGGNGEQVKLYIDNYTLIFTFNTNTPHKVNVSLGELGDTYTAYLDTGGTDSKYAYVLYKENPEYPDNQPPNGEYVGSISGINQTSYGWWTDRWYTGDPWYNACCYIGCPRTYGLSDCPHFFESNIPEGASVYEISNGGCFCTPVTPPIVTVIENSGVPYECEDGEYAPSLLSAPNCAKYGYGTNAGADGPQGWCEELKTYTSGDTRDYYFENCRTAFNLKASIGYSSTIEPPEDYEPPSFSVSVGTDDTGCGEGGTCRGYVYTFYKNILDCTNEEEEPPTNIIGAPLIYKGMVNRLASSYQWICDHMEDNNGSEASISDDFVTYYNPNAAGCPSHRDPGVDYCAIIETVDDSNDGYVGDVYQVINSGKPSSYEIPTCPTQLISVNYNTDSIKITIGGNTKCIDIPYKKECKNVKITLPNRDYYITESIESECDSDRHTPSLSLNNGKQIFLTVDTTLTFPIGTYTVADVNDGPRILWARASRTKCELGSEPDYHKWSGVGLCGVADEPPWIYYIDPLDPFWVADTAGLGSTLMGEFVSRISNLANSLNTVPLGPATPEGTNAELSRWLKNPNYSPSTDLIRGPLGGGSLHIDFSTVTKSKYKPGQQSTYDQITARAYVTVPYRIPVSTVSAIQNTTSAAMCDNGYDTNIEHPFPDWYGDLMGTRTYDNNTGRYFMRNVASKNFAIMNSSFTITCDGLKSNYNDDILDDRMFIRPCPRTDYACWIKQQWTETIDREWR